MSPPPLSYFTAIGLSQILTLLIIQSLPDSLNALTGIELTPSMLLAVVTVASKLFQLHIKEIICH